MGMCNGFFVAVLERKGCNKSKERKHELDDPVDSEQVPESNEAVVDDIEIKKKKKKKSKDKLPETEENVNFNEVDNCELNHSKPKKKKKDKKSKEIQEISEELNEDESEKPRK